MAVPTPPFNPNLPTPNNPFHNESEEFMIQTGDKLITSGPIVINEGEVEVEAQGVIGDIDCGEI